MFIEHYNTRQELKKITLENINWSKIYMNCYDNSDIIAFRKMFNQKIDELEQQEDIILTIDKFEWGFIDFLKEKGYQFRS